MLKKIFTAIFIIVFMYTIILSFITAHEAIHSYIFTRYGLENEISFTFFPFPKGVVTPVGDYALCNDFCKTQHALNDIIGYNLIILLQFWLFSLFVLRQKKKNGNKTS